VLPTPPDRPSLEQVVRALRVDGVYVQPSLRDRVGPQQEARIEDAVATIAYPVKVVVLGSGTDQRDAGEVLVRLHQVALRDLTVDPAVYLGVDLAAGDLTAHEFDLTTRVGQAIPVAADRAPGLLGRQLVITTTLLSDNTSEGAYHRLTEETGTPVESAPVQSPAGTTAQPQPGGAVDLTAVLVTLAVLAAACLSALWTRRRVGS